MRRLICSCICIVLLLIVGVTTAESFTKMIEQQLPSATDEELEQAAHLIKNEQRSRLNIKIILEPMEASVSKGKTVKISAEIIDLPEDVKAGKLTWNSANPDIASCQNGTIRGAAAGITTVTCSTVLSDGTEINADCVINVVVPVQKISVKEKQISIMASDIYTPVFEFSPADATDCNVILTSSDESIVKSDEDGNLVAVSAGKAIVTATTTDGSNKTATISVTVTKKIGKFDGAITFQGVEWRSNFESCYKKLQTDGFITEEAAKSYLYHTATGNYYWPDEDIKFAYLSGPDKLPASLNGAGGKTLTIEPLKTIGGYNFKMIKLSFLNNVKEDGSVDTEAFELTGVRIDINSNDYKKTAAEVFKDLLAKLEAKYGAFTVYISKQYAEQYFRNSELLKDAIIYVREGHMIHSAFGVLHGADNTGLMLQMINNNQLHLFYGTTDTWEQIQIIEENLEKTSLMEEGEL